MINLNIVKIIMYKHIYICSDQNNVRIGYIRFKTPRFQSNVLQK